MSLINFANHTFTDLHPSIVTKRHTSIIAADEEICPHQESTSTLDYGGEVAVIIGKAGFRIDEKDAMDHVWGYTIVNNIGARKKPQDHRQSFVGKSADTFCPMVGQPVLYGTAYSELSLPLSGSNCSTEAEPPQYLTCTDTRQWRETTGWDYSGSDLFYTEADQVLVSCNDSPAWRRYRYRHAGRGWL